MWTIVVGWIIGKFCLGQSLHSSRHSEVRFTRRKLSGLGRDPFVRSGVATKVFHWEGKLYVMNKVNKLDKGIGL